MQDHTLRLVSLADDGHVGMLKRRKLFLVSLALALEFLGNLLLKDERFEGVVSLLLGTGQTNSKASRIVFLLLDERCETAIFALVGLDLDFKVLSFFGKLISERLEFKKLAAESVGT